MRLQIGRPKAWWLLAVGGALICGAAAALVLRGHRERPDPGLAGLAIGLIVAQLGLAWLSAGFRSRGRLYALTFALVAVPPLVLIVGFVLVSMGVPWDVAGLPAFLAALSAPFGWMAFGAAAAGAGLIGPRLAAGVLWSALLLFLFDAGSLRALAAVPLGVSWLAVAATVAGTARDPRRQGGLATRPGLTALIVVVLVSVVGLVGLTRSTARPMGTPGDGPNGSTLTIVIDTDSQPDDWMAITYLLARRDVDVRAITVTGSAALGCADGQRQVLRLLALFGRADVPVACGRTALTPGGHPFPTEWRQGNLDLMRDVPLPDPLASPDPRPAPDLLAAVLGQANAPVTIIALGPLTNLLDAFVADAHLSERVAEVVIMGGAMDVGGNTGGGPAEWNIYVDPGAASYVFGFGRPITLIALDATNDAPVTQAAAQRIRAEAPSPAGRFVADLLAAMTAFVESGDYFFWDPLAAVAATDDRIAGFLRERLDVVTSGEESGRVVRAPLGGIVWVAVSADAAAFHEVFIRTLAGAR